MTTVLLVAVAGGLGAVARFLLDGVVRARTRTGHPLGTTVVNLTGSLLLGLVTGMALGHLLTGRWPVVLGSGFLGGYTTFSTAMTETVRLLQERRYGAAAVHGLGLLFASVALAQLGLVLGLHL